MADSSGAPIGQVRTKSGIQSAAVADLTAASGTADGTVDDVGASFSQTTLNNNFKELAVKINALLAALRAAKVLKS